ARQKTIDMTDTAEPQSNSTQELFDTSVTFADLGLSQRVVEGLTATGFVHPTGIQAALIPPVLAGKDVIGQAKTGTGKTAAFGLPILSLCDPDVRGQALVLAPTRELAAQVAGELDNLGRATQIRTSVIIGGESMRNQQKSMADGGHLIVGTPGRVMDLHQRGQLSFNDIRFVVLDEVDRMLDIGFREDIRKILKAIPNPVSGSRQTIFVSATMDLQIERLARSFMKPDAEKITTVSGSLTVAMVDQKYLSVEPWDKRSLLLKLLVREKPETTVVFCKTKATVRKVAEYLKKKELNVREIHGDLQQSKRNKVMDAFRQEKVDVLIASDLAARGLDVDHITHVINYDLPEDPEIYIHRIGRTARAGRRGHAWTFVTPEQGQMLTEVEKMAGAMIEKMDYPEFTPGPVPKDVQEERRTGIKRRDKPRDISDRSVASVVDPTAGYSEAELKAMFPDGKIPKTLPPKNLGAKFKRRGR
ncbi:MAG: DEAD/DEAH box helicase, partial [Planctomycetota bacterium]